MNKIYALKYYKMKRCIIVMFERTGRKTTAQPKIKLTCAALLTAMILGRITPETVLITIISSEIFYLPFRCMTENEFFTTECINAFSFKSNISMLAY